MKLSVVLGNTFFDLSANIFAHLFVSVAGKVIVKIDRVIVEVALLVLFNKCLPLLFLKHLVLEEDKVNGVIFETCQDFLKSWVDLRTYPDLFEAYNKFAGSVEFELLPLLLLSDYPSLYEFLDPLEARVLLPGLVQVDVLDLPVQHLHIDPQSVLDGLGIRASHCEQSRIIGLQPKVED